MTETSLFKRAYTRGLAADLMRTGTLAFPTKEAADHAADYVADHSGMPDPLTNGGAISLKVAADLCGMLKQASDTLCQQAGGYSPGLSKSAAASDPATVAQEEAVLLMRKVAMEVSEGPNSLERAARTDQAAAMDQAARPQGYANTGVGNYIDMGKGSIGVEEPQPRKDADPGLNSPIENSMKSAAQRLASKIAGTYAGTPGSPPANTLANAAQHNAAAAMDQAARPQGYANVGVNASKFKVPAGATIGSESPISRPNHPAGSNTVTQAVKSAQDRLLKVADQTMPFLFSDLSEIEKVAHVRAMSKLGKLGRAQYLHQMYGAYGLDKTASFNNATAYLKLAEDEGDDDEGCSDDDSDVASALAEAAHEIGEGDKKEKAEEEMKEASVNALRAAIGNVRR